MKPKQNRIGMISALALFIALAFLFIPECDDNYFRYWRFDSLFDLINTNPAQSDVVGVPQNGRYLGNLMGIFMSWLYNNALILRAAFIGGSFFALCLLMSAACKNKSGSFLIGMAAIVCAPTSLWKDMFTWTASYCNYFLPLILIIGAVLMFTKNRLPVPALFAFSALVFAAQLFSETVTLFSVMLGGLLLLLSLFERDRERLLRSALWLLFALLGALIMFSDPGYASLGSRTLGRVIEMSAILEMVLECASTVLFENLLFFLCSSVILLTHYGKQKTWKNYLSRVYLGFSAIVFILSILQRSKLIDLSLPFRFALGIIGLALFLTLVFAMKNKKLSLHITLLIILCIGVLCVFVIMIPVFPRHHSLIYFISFAAIALVYKEVGRLPEKLLLPLISVFTAMLFFVYGCNYIVDRQRCAEIESAMQSGQSEVSVPLVPFTEFTTNESIYKGDLRYIYYYQKPWDFKIKFHPYK